MPSYAPRSEPIKKVEELDNRKLELQSAIHKKYTGEKLIRAVEKYRKAYLSFLKAKLHVQKKEYKNKLQTVKVEKVNAEFEIWTNKTVQEILSEIK